jgi:predicted  nucleic acid-binding Zn-ribbon protein
MTTTATATSVEEILQALANLQFIDSRIDEIERLRGDLPDEIYDIESDVQYLEARIDKLQQDDRELILEDLRLAGEYEDCLGLIRKYEAQQMTVRNNREYDALTKEIESQKQRADNALSRKEEIRSILERLKIDLREAQVRLEQTRTLLHEKKANLETVIEKTAEEEKKLLEIRHGAAGYLPERYLKNYERLRNGLNNRIAVAAMERGACLGTLLTPQIQMEVKKRTRIVLDENSGRIVVDPAFFDNARRQFSAHTGA